MRQSFRWPWVEVSCLLALSWLAPAPAHTAPSRSQDLAPSSTAPVALRDGVIVDAARGVAYVMNRGGGVDALRTSDGSTIWSSPEAARPLLVRGDLLVAQAEAKAAGELPVLTLDRASGRTLSRAAVALPASLFASVKDGPRSSFRVSASALDGGVLVRWEARRAGKGNELQGYVPSPDEGRAPETAAAPLHARAAGELLQGSAVLDPRAGTVRLQAKTAVAAAPMAVAVLRTFSGLREVSGRKFLSADGRHVLVSEAVEPRQVFERYRWSIYTRGGDLVGELASHRSAAPFVVAGSRLLFESRPYGVRSGDEMVERPLQLRAFDLASGGEAWAQTLRQVEFGGPFPP